jgi:hypothetical protein
MTHTTYRMRFRHGKRVLSFFAVLTAALMLTCIFSRQPEEAAGPPNDTRYPVLLELFTSEGCSSCPPADDWVQKLDSMQPIRSEQIIVLSEHVDYWDHDGWKDPYDSALLTERQNGYAHKLGLDDVYTPQLILDGTSELHLNDTKGIQEAFVKADTTPPVAVRIDSVEVDAGKPSTLRGRVQVNANSQEPSDGDVYVVTALDHADSQVLKGENGGRHLSYVAVVEDIAKIGNLETGKSFERNFDVRLKPGSDPKNLRVIAFVQEPNFGKVIGAAMEKTTP